MPKTFEIIHHRPITCYLEFNSYKDGEAVTLMSWDAEGEYWEPEARLSINTDHDMEPGDFVLNHDCKGLMEPLVALGLFEPTGQTVNYGYIRDQPVYHITDKAREFVDN